MDENEKEVVAPAATAAAPSTAEQIQAIADYVEAALGPLMPLVLGDQRKTAQTALANMKEAINGKSVS